MASSREIDFREGFDVEQAAAGRIRVRLDLSEVSDQVAQLNITAIDGGNAFGDFGDGHGIDGGSA